MKRQIIVIQLARKLWDDLPVQSILGSMIERTGFFIHRRRDFENTENQPDKLTYDTFGD